MDSTAKGESIGFETSASVTDSGDSFFRLIGCSRSQARSKVQMN
jgi:hypothetical protein